MQNADAMLVISGKMADDAISPDITLVDLETIYPEKRQPTHSTQLMKNFNVE